MSIFYDCWQSRFEHALSFLLLLVVASSQLFSGFGHGGFPQVVWNEPWSRGAKSLLVLVPSTAVLELLFGQWWYLPLSSASEHCKFGSCS